MIVEPEEAGAVLRSGGVVAIPTDTVYGLAVDPERPSATGRLFALKGRPDAVALPVLTADAASASRIGRFDAAARALADRFWPGALTLVVERAPAAMGYELGGDPRSIGLRCPAHEAARALLERTGPLAVSSANLHGETPCHSADEVAATFGDTLPILDGGTCGGVPSTVVRLGPGGLECLREGAIDVADLQGLLDEVG